MVLPLVMAALAKKQKNENNQPNQIVDPLQQEKINDIRMAYDTIRDEIKEAHHELETMNKVYNDGLKKFLEAKSSQIAEEMKMKYNLNETDFYHVKNILNAESEIMTNNNITKIDRIFSHPISTSIYGGLRMGAGSQSFFESVNRLLSFIPSTIGFALTFGISALLSLSILFWIDILPGAPLIYAWVIPGFSAVLALLMGLNK